LCAIAQALSLYSQGRTGEGIEILRKLPPEKLREPHHAVYSAILMLDEGQTDAAREFIDAANAGPLFPEEKKLLDESIEKAQHAPPAPPPAAAETAASPARDVPQNTPAPEPTTTPAAAEPSPP
jgi:hypothetical protein